jgi:hypothetical protein
MRDFTMTTCRFGSHEVADVMMSHRQCMDIEPTPAVWVDVRVPLALYEVAAVVSEVFASLDELAGVSTAEARYWVTGLVCGGGGEMVDQAVTKVNQWNATGQLDTDYWQACLDLAAAMIADTGERTTEGREVSARRWLTRASCRFGAHEVAGVAMMHRGMPGMEPAPAVWLQVPVPLTLHEVASVLSEACTGEAGPHPDDVAGLERTPDQARRFIAETVCDSGTELVVDAALRIDEMRSDGRLDNAYWRDCLATARAAVTPPRRSRTSERMPERPAQRGRLATAGDAR